MPVVMISGHGTIETAVQAIQHGAYDFIEKPFQSDRLLLVVRRALEAAAAGARERRTAAARRAGDGADRRQRRDFGAAGGGGEGGADRLAGADHRPRRVGQGGRGADDPRALAPGRAGRSWR